MTDNLSTAKSKNELTSDSIQVVTYIDLTDAYCTQFLNDGKSRQKIKNIRSAINSWRESLRIKVDAPIGVEFLADFDLCLQKYIGNQIVSRISAKTYPGRVSNIKACRNFYIRQLKMATLPIVFNKRLAYLLDINNYSAKKFWEHHLSESIKYDTLLNWISGKTIPKKFKFFVVEIIERYLNVPVNTLTSTLKRYPIALSPAIMGSNGQKAQKLLKKKYCVWTIKLDVEYKDFVSFKTSAILPDEMVRRKNSVWTGADENHLFPTAKIVKSYLKSFFGFCCLPVDSTDEMMRGLGLEKDKLSLALLADAKIVEEYLTVFRLKRSGGKYNGGFFRFIHEVISLLREETGYLYQKPELTYKTKSRKNIQLWQKKCLDTRQRLIKLKDFIEDQKKSGSQLYSVGRDPEAPIRNILESPRPVFHTMQMLSRMLEDTGKFKDASLRQAILYRDALIIAMLQANPLRINMFSNMRLNQHLIKKENGSWWLKFKRHEFKNRHSLGGDYEVRVAPDIWRLIDEYVSKFRPRLCGADACSKVFLSSYNPTKSRKSHGIPSNMLSILIAYRTRQYIPGSGGFRPHAFRHIVATDIIKSNPEYGFFLAAKVLHDKLATVEANYAHLKTSEFFEPYNALFSQAWKTISSSDSKTADSNSVNNNQDSDSKDLDKETRDEK